MNITRMTFRSISRMLETTQDDATLVLPFAVCRKVAMRQTTKFDCNSAVQTEYWFELDNAKKVTAKGLIDTRSFHARLLYKVDVYDSRRGQWLGQLDRGTTRHTLTGTRLVQISKHKRPAASLWREANDALLFLRQDAAENQAFLAPTDLYELYVMPYVTA